MKKLSEVIYEKLNVKRISVEEIRKRREIQEEIENDRFFWAIKASLLGVVEKRVINNPDHWRCVSKGEWDLSLGNGRKIKIFVRHNGAVEGVVNKGANLRDYWLVVSGGVTNNNDLGYTLKGCEGGEAEEFAKTRKSGKKLYRVLDFGSMRNINLVRRIAVGC